MNGWILFYPVRSIIWFHDLPSPVIGIFQMSDGTIRKLVILKEPKQLTPAEMAQIIGVLVVVFLLVGGCCVFGISRTGLFKRNSSSAAAVAMPLMAQQQPPVQPIPPAQVGTIWIISLRKQQRGIWRLFQNNFTVCCSTVLHEFLQKKLPYQYNSFQARLLFRIPTLSQLAASASRLIASLFGCLESVLYYSLLSFFSYQYPYQPVAPNPQVKGTLPSQISIRRMRVVMSS